MPTYSSVKAKMAVMAALAAVVIAGCAAPRPEVSDLSLYREHEKQVSDAGYFTVLARNPKGCVMATFPGKGTQYIAGFPVGSTLEGDTIKRPEGDPITLGTKTLIGGQAYPKNLKTVSIASNCDDTDTEIWLIR